MDGCVSLQMNEVSVVHGVVVWWCVILDSKLVILEAVSK